MLADIKITTEMLYQGALVFALMDIVFVALLMWRIKRDTFLALQNFLPLTAALIWLGIWGWAIGNFWETVYIYVFPKWGQAWIPIIAFFAAGVVAIGLWTLAIRNQPNHILVYTLLSGTLGSLTHIWAVCRGIVTKPPMLQVASPIGAVVIAFFEYIFYWCTILVLAAGMKWLYRKLSRSKY